MLFTCISASSKQFLMVDKEMNMSRHCLELYYNLVFVALALSQGLVNIFPHSHKVP